MHNNNFHSSCRRVLVRRWSEFEVPYIVGKFRPCRCFCLRVHLGLWFQIQFRAQTDQVLRNILTQHFGISDHPASARFPSRECCMYRRDEVSSKGRCDAVRSWWRFGFLGSLMMLVGWARANTRGWPKIAFAHTNLIQIYIYPSRSAQQPP